MAIAILVVAVIGPLTLASSSIKAFSAAKNNLIAAGLAQEGIELMRNYRADNVFKGSGWTAGMDGCFLASGCQIDVAAFDIISCGTSCSNLNFDQNSGLYSYIAGAPTIFIRKINAETINANEIKIKVSVSWQERFGQQNFELEEYLLDW